MQILVTGADGFIGSNLCHHLAERGDVTLRRFTRENTVTDLRDLVAGVDFVIHLAGINRPKDSREFWTGNTHLTEELCAAVGATGQRTPLIYASSIQALGNTEYGQSKRESEDAVISLHKHSNSQVRISRLPNVFGKWCKPSYNSVVATFCHKLAHEQPIHVNDPTTALTLVYIDDVVKSFMHQIDMMYQSQNDSLFFDVTPRYTITLGDLADKLRSFMADRTLRQVSRVGTGLERALYATLLSYLPPSGFTYPLTANRDQRGSFVEVLRTLDSGQFSYFTAGPGITRGGHYHHTKNEKFVVMHGSAKFRFQNMRTGEQSSVTACGDHPMIVETIPGWAHDITNVGNTELIVLLWANEAFQPAHPDTIMHRMD